MHRARQVHIVLLLGLVPLDVEDELLARRQVLRAPLCLEHRRECRIIDVADVAQRVRRIRAIQDAIRLPAGGYPGPIAMPSNLPLPVVAINAPYSWSFNSASMPMSLR